MSISSHSPVLPLFHPWKSQISMDLPIWSFNITKSHNTWHLASGTAFFYFFQGSSMWYMYLHFIPFHSRSIYPLAWYSILHLSSHQLIDMWVVPTFWLLWVILVWTIVYKSLCEICVFISLGQIHRNRIVGLYGKFVFDFLKTLPNIFQSDCSILFCGYSSRRKILFHFC